MRKIGAFMLLAILMVSVAAAEDKPEVNVKTMPPSVIKTVPQAGDTAVDPSTKEIRVTFSKDMLTERMWSVCQISKETFPKIVGNIHYLDDKRTCVIPVTLKPGKTYVLWFNKGRFNSFRDTGNNPSVPYLLVFQTKKVTIQTPFAEDQAVGKYARKEAFLARHYELSSDRRRGAPAKTLWMASMTLKAFFRMVEM